jgi:hypothetical protein
MRVDLGATAGAALDAGLALRFLVEFRGDDGRERVQTLMLRASPLLRSYNLAIGSEAPQPHGLRNALLVAFENARITFDADEPCAGGCPGRARVRLDVAALPAPLRLPALVDPAWQLDSGWVETVR